MVILTNRILSCIFLFHLTMEISTGQSFFKPKLPTKSHVQDWETTQILVGFEKGRSLSVGSLLSLKYRVYSLLFHVLCIITYIGGLHGDGVCNSWNQFDYELEAASCNENDKGLHNNAILKSGFIVFYSGRPCIQLISHTLF